MMADQQQTHTTCTAVTSLVAVAETTSIAAATPPPLYTLPSLLTHLETIANILSHDGRAEITGYHWRAPLAAADHCRIRLDVICGQGDTAARTRRPPLLDGARMRRPGVVRPLRPAKVQERRGRGGRRGRRAVEGSRTVGRTTGDEDGAGLSS